MKIAFVNRSLGAGGAERQLVCLSRGLVGRGHDVSILTFYPDGVLEKDLAGTGVDLIGLDKSGRWEVVRFLARVMKRMRAVEPDVIHGYMPVESALGLLVARQLRVPFVWGVRASSLPIELYDRVSRIPYPTPAPGLARAPRMRAQ